jgi:hypothetical protein
MDILREMFRNFCKQPPRTAAFYLLILFVSLYLLISAIFQIIDEYLGVVAVIILVLVSIANRYTILRSCQKIMLRIRSR